MATTQTLIVTEHQAREWSRMAQDAYSSDRNEFGHRFSMAAAVYWGKPCQLAIYDTLMTQYRRWLIGGWSEVESPR
jgi:hypothetical protein